MKILEISKFIIDFQIYIYLFDHKRPKIRLEIYLTSYVNDIRAFCSIHGKNATKLPL